MKKITITNAYTWYNKGDAGILLGIVSALKKEYGENNIEINVLSFTPEEDKKRYCKDKCIKNVYSNTLNPYPYKYTKIGKLFAIIKLFFRMCKLYLKGKISLNNLIKNEESYNILNESDIIIVCGGGFLGGKKYNSLMHLFQIYVDTLFEKPVIVMGTSIEPIKRNLIKKCTENILKKVDFVYAREKITYDYLKTFMNSEKFTLIPDMAFMLDEKNKKFEVIDQIRKKSNIIFGITVRKWNFPNHNIKQKEPMLVYIDAIVNMMKKYIKEKNAYFVFVPQVIVENGDDTIVAKKIRESLPDEFKENFVILDNDFSPLDIKSLIGNFDYFIGTRMHSNIFSTSMGIPTVAIAYEKKTNGIMETVGLSDYVVEIDDITDKKLIDKVDKCIKNSVQIRNELNKTIPELKEKIMTEIDKNMRKYKE